MFIICKNDWIDQYKRVLRHREAVNKRLPAQCESEFYELQDAYINFFIHCYNLHDWLLECGYGDVSEYVKNSHYLKTCKGVADGLKHYELKRNHYRGTHFRLFGMTEKSITVSSSTGTSGSYLHNDSSIPINPTVKMNIGDYHIESSIISYIKASDLMNKCIDEWNDYIASKNLLGYL